MPKIVDHEHRRQEIVDALLVVASRDGHHRMTSRAVAEELGIASGALWHYFPNFDAVIRAAALEITRRTLTRIEHAGDGLRGLVRFDAIMHEVLPLREDTRVEAAVVVGFWGRTAVDNDPSPVAHGGDRWAGHLRDALAEARADGELRAETPLADLLAVVQSLSYGQQVAEVIDGPLPVQTHVRVVRSCIEPWMSDRQAATR